MKGSREYLIIAMWGTTRPQGRLSALQGFSLDCDWAGIKEGEALLPRNLPNSRRVRANSARALRLGP